MKYFNFKVKIICIMADKNLIIQLIQNDLKNAKLTLGLNKLGLDASNYYLNLKELLFGLLCFEKNEQEEKLFEAYVSYAEKVQAIDVIQHPEKLMELADEIYNWLMAEQEVYHREALKANAELLELLIGKSLSEILVTHTGKELMRLSMYLINKKICLPMNLTLIYINSYI
jgi:hypothetical protein